MYMLDTMLPNRQTSVAMKTSERMREARLVEVRSPDAMNYARFKFNGNGNVYIVCYHSHYGILMLTMAIMLASLGLERQFSSSHHEQDFLYCNQLSIHCCCFVNIADEHAVAGGRRCMARELLVSS